MVDSLLDIKWRLEHDDNLDEFMVAQKVNIFLRKIASMLTYYEKLTREGDVLTLKFTSTFKNHTMVFKLGEEFLDHGADGRDMMITFHEEDDKLVAILLPVHEGDVPGRFERKVLPDGRLEVTCISTPTNTICKRYFVRDEKK